MRKFYWLLMLTGLAACFEYNPNQLVLKDEYKNLTVKNLARIGRQIIPDTAKIIFMGDTQRFYSESDDFVSHVNTLKGVSFVLHGGDISDFGLSKEYIWIHEIMSGLRYPYLTAIGNHDLVANGEKVYRLMFGAKNYSFEFGDYKFIIIDTNSREYNFNGKVPDLNWLKKELDDNAGDKRVIVVSHIAPFDADFDPALKDEFTKLLADDPDVVLSLHAHSHSFLDKVYYNDGVRYVVTTSVQDRAYLMLELWKDGLRIEEVKY